jgi:hypothetical protein
MTGGDWAGAVYGFSGCPGTCEGVITLRQRGRVRLDLTLANKKRRLRQQQPERVRERVFRVQLGEGVRIERGQVLARLHLRVRKRCLRWDHARGFG